MAYGWLLLIKLENVKKRFQIFFCFTKIKNFFFPKNIEKNWIYLIVAPESLLDYIQTCRIDNGQMTAHTPPKYLSRRQESSADNVPEFDITVLWCPSPLNLDTQIDPVAEFMPWRIPTRRRRSSPDWRLILHRSGTRTYIAVTRPRCIYPHRIHWQCIYTLRHILVKQASLTKQSRWIWKLSFIEPHEKTEHVKWS